MVWGRTEQDRTDQNRCLGCTRAGSTQPLTPSLLAGKGANTPFILKTRGFQGERAGREAGRQGGREKGAANAERVCGVCAAKSIQISDLLAFRPEVVSIMKAGGLVSDSLVLHILMAAILQLDHAQEGAAGEEEEGQVSGAVVDGFPRTTLQVDLVKLLYDK